MPFDVDRSHPLAIGLRSLWLPAQDAGEDRLRNLAGGGAAGVVDVMTFPATVGERPTWAAGQAGEALDFDGVNDYLSRTTNLPWQPVTEGGDVTVAVYCEIFAYPGSSTVEMWSTQYAPGTVDRVTALIGLRQRDATIRGRITLNEAGGAAETAIAWPPLRTPFLAIFTSRGENDHEMAVFAPGLGVPSFITNATSRRPIASFNPTSEVLGNEIYAGATDAAFNGRIYGTWVWNRGLTRTDLTAFLLDPFAMVSPQRNSGGISLSTSADAFAPGATPSTTWSITAGTAGAGASGTGATLTSRWSVISGGAVSAADRIVSGTSYATTWQIIPGVATASSPAGSAVLASAWSIRAGTATSNAVAVAGATVTTTWSLTAGTAGQARPRPDIGGGGGGPGAPGSPGSPGGQGGQGGAGGKGGRGHGGRGAAVSKDTSRKVRNSAARALAAVEGREFWPDPEDLDEAELEEWAAKAEAAGVPVLPGESEAEFAARISAEVEQFMAQQEVTNHEALILLMLA